MRVLRDDQLTIDLSKVRENYRILTAQLSAATCAAAVKADGYGLGAIEVSHALWNEGCREFFVALVDEGISLRRGLPEATIYVLNGAMPGTEDDLITANLVPVLNSLGQIEVWRTASARVGRPLPAAVHIDTGMSRLGLPASETERLLGDLSLLNGIDVSLVMSHLASADEVDTAQTVEQLKLFSAARTGLSMGRASLANSAGIFHGSDYQFDVVRPGIALYGGNPTPGQPNLMQSTVRLECPVIQVREVLPGESVGYGATWTASEHRSIATVSVGYADGFLRSSSNVGQASFGGTLAPIVGRVSMDLITVDVTDIDDALLYPGAPVELIGENRSIDDVASAAGTISYEFLANMGSRYHTRYEGE